MFIKYLIEKFSQIRGFQLFCFLISLILLSLPLNMFAQNHTSVDKTVELKAVPGLKYDKVRFTVEPGSTVRIALENVDEMMHNLLLVKPGTREEVVKQAEAIGGQGTQNDYISNSSKVLAYTSFLKPGEKASIIFQVPEEEGIYPYVCTYPAHGLVMYGAMYVTNNPTELPRIDEDPNIPEPVRNEMAANKSAHPYPMEMPTLTRLFMPESSPAAIAVGMEKNQSYNWDAGFSHLRYVWDGGYIDASKQWDAKAHEVAKIEGDIYYRNTTGFPFRIVRQDSIPEPDFKGYTLTNGYPEFKYQMGDVTVRELILPAEKLPGFQIQYTLENINEPIWYVLSDNENLQVDTSKGEIKGNMIKLTSEQAREFTITIISDE